MAVEVVTVIVRVRTQGLVLALGVTACVTATARPAPLPRPAAAPAGFVRYPAVEAAHVKNIHAYRGKPVCQACHVLDSERLLDGPACGGCHQTPHSRGHDVGTPIADKISLPLVEGKVACHTCHDPHDTKRERFGLWKELNALCRDCHRRH